MTISFRSIARGEDLLRGNRRGPLHTQLGLGADLPSRELGPETGICRVSKRHMPNFLSESFFKWC